MNTIDLFVQRESEHKKSSYASVPLCLQLNTEHKTQFGIKDFEIGRPLGRGAYGRVYLAREVQSKTIVAIKQIRLKEIKDNGMEIQMRRELEIQPHLKHKNILKLYTAFYTEKCLYLVTEYAPGGELFKLLQKETRFPEMKASCYIKQVIEAVMYLHSKKVIHRDIKPENLLLSNGTIKLCDFGWSSNICNRKKRNTVCGTKDYFAPEMIQKNACYDYRVDIWCIGVLAYEFLIGVPPFNSDSDAARNKSILDCKVVFPMDIPLSDICKHFIHKILVSNKEERMSLEEALQHPFITKYN